MCYIGEEKRVLVVEPLELPVGNPERIEPEPEPVTVPEPERVPAPVRRG